MTDSEVKAFLEEQGYPDHLVQAGKKGILQHWEEFVAEVERGYSLTLDDYRNDLDLRALISRLGLQADVEEADARFRRMLVFCEASLWDCDDNPDAFWLYGFPRNARGELLEDLRNEGFIE